LAALHATLQKHSYRYRAIVMHRLLFTHAWSQAAGNKPPDCVGTDCAVSAAAVPSFCGPKRKTPGLTAK